jgi:hypothetical protein
MFLLSSVLAGNEAVLAKLGSIRAANDVWNNGLAFLAFVSGTQQLTGFQDELIKGDHGILGGDLEWLSILSLSLDSDPAAPRKFSRNHDLAWTQGFLGDWSNDKVTPTYGVESIPAILLVGPDGRVVATQLRGAKIKEAVAAALAP